MCILLHCSVSSSTKDSPFFWRSLSRAAGNYPTKLAIKGVISCCFPKKWNGRRHIILTTIIKMIIQINIHLTDIILFVFFVSWCSIGQSLWRKILASFNEQGSAPGNQNKGIHNNNKMMAGECRNLQILDVLPKSLISLRVRIFKTNGWFSEAGMCLFKLMFGSDSHCFISLFLKFLLVFS